MPEAGLKNKRRLGYVVIAALVVIKVAEYLLGTTMRSGALPYLAVLALAGAWCILYYFMHINQLWRPRGKDDE
ncbi:MAG: hypothetical protein HY663_00400 [Chloroflexi bacterium]|nr:hypothetical protein [Chloroflexota bacterium]